MNLNQHCARVLEALAAQGFVAPTVTANLRDDGWLIAASGVYAGNSYEMSMIIPLGFGQENIELIAGEWADDAIRSAVQIARQASSN